MESKGRPSYTNIGKNLKILNDRKDYLGEKIRENKCSDQALGYHCAEFQALHWAISILETMNLKGAFREKISG